MLYANARFILRINHTTKATPKIGEPMKLFISWSGERSKAFAIALRDWMPLVLHYAEPWLSEADIEAGARWADSVAKELETCNFGVICITRENLNAPWILFESGALAKSLQGSRVIPLLLDLDFREITGPLAQFQAKKMARDGLLETIQSINQLATHPVPDERYKQLFDALWPELERKIGAIPKQASPTKQSRPQGEVLEELVGAVRTMEARIRDGADDPRRSNKRLNRFPPMMMRDLSRSITSGPEDVVHILVLASTFRDDIPWLYELGMEAYRHLSAGHVAEGQEALRRFAEACDMLRHGPFDPMDFGLDSKHIHLMLRNLDGMLGHNKSELSDKRRPVKTDDSSS